MKFVTFYIVAISLSSAASLNNRKTRLLPEGRILRGQNAAKRQFPYMVGLLLQDDPANENYEICGGSLIGHQWVLTAAHCTVNIIEILVFLGAIDRRYHRIRHFVSPESFIVHPDYEDKYHSNDIALIKIPFTNYTRNIQPVRLPSFASINSTYNGETAEMPGWGCTLENSDYLAEHLQWAEFKVIENSLCAETYGSRITFNICVGIDAGIRPYGGDSGGPLVLKSTNTQIGINSFSTELQYGEHLPVAFTRITRYLEWIKLHTEISY